jgi:endonuclease/exonuclease/phosphatase family metal-dependent hydrolase
MGDTTRRPRVRIRRLRGDDPHAERREALSAVTPYLGLVRAPTYPAGRPTPGPEIVVATYNVHRWTARGSGRDPDPERAAFVISELGADVIALQEAVRPFAGEDPLVRLADRLRLHLAFVTTRIHRIGELGNAILSRWPIASASLLDLNFSRLERRTAVATQLATAAGPLSLVATHLALVDRTRHRQVRHLLDHPQLQGPVVLMGDMNAWRANDKAVLALEAGLPTHTEIDWPASFPAARPVLALDRIYARGAKLIEVRAHLTPAARRASDHLPVIARIKLL